MKLLAARCAVVFLLAAALLDCQPNESKRDLRDAVPRAFYQVPSDRLAYRLEPDVDYESPAAPAEKAEAVQKDFDAKRQNDALIRTVTSPDGLRVLALYATGDTPEGDFRIDIYSADGTISRPIMPLDLTGTFPQSVVWSPDSQLIAFIGYKTGSSAQDTSAGKKSDKKSNAKNAPPDLPPDETTANANNPAALIPPVNAYRTEQIYICNREGIELKPLTTREGLIYFALSWSPQSVALAALACKEDEWNARRDANLAPAGRPRLITLDGGERLLDDRLTDVTPVWSPDGAKLASAFDTQVAIYDAGPTAMANAPTAAAADLHDELLESSVKYDETKLKKTDANEAGKKENAAKESGAAANNAATSETPLSFNPIVKLEWKKPDAILVETGFVRVYRGDQIVSKYLRWHALYLSPQASVVGAPKTSSSIVNGKS
jgi:hypothetical protein